MQRMYKTAYERIKTITNKTSVAVMRSTLCGSVSDFLRLVHKTLANNSGYKCRLSALGVTDFETVISQFGIRALMK